MQEEIKKYKFLVCYCNLLAQVVLVHLMGEEKFAEIDKKLRAQAMEMAGLEK
jgi:hypothetical protein